MSRRERKAMIRRDHPSLSKKATKTKNSRTVNGKPFTASKANLHVSMVLNAVDARSNLVN